MPHIYTVFSESTVTFASFSKLAFFTPISPILAISLADYVKTTWDPGIKIVTKTHAYTRVKNDTDASKAVAGHFNVNNHSHHNITIRGLSLHHGNTESRKTNKNSSFNWVHSIHTGSMNTFHSTNLFTNHVTIFPPMAKLLHTPMI